MRMVGGTTTSTTSGVTVILARSQEPFRVKMYGMSVFPTVRTGIDLLGKVLERELFDFFSQSLQVAKTLAVDLLAHLLS